jgi:hypothetical protein
MFDIVCHKSAIWFWNLFYAHTLQSITAQLWRLFGCQGLPDAGCALKSGRHWHVHMISFMCWVWPTTPAGPGFRTLRFFCIQALWQCLSMPGKPRPLEALNSIVSAGPRDLRRNKSCSNGVRVHRTVTWWRVPGASRNRLASVKKVHFVAGEYGGATLRIYGVAVGPRGRTLRV